MSDKDNHPIVGFMTGGFPGGKLPVDPRQTGRQYLRTTLDGMSDPTNHPLIPKTHGSTFKDQSSFSGCADPGTQCMFQPAYPGALHGTVLGNLMEFPEQGGVSGTSSVVNLHTQQMAQNPSNQPLQGTKAKVPFNPDTRDGGVKNYRMKKNKQYVPDNERMNKPHWGQWNLSPWDQKSNIPTADTPAAGLMNMGMLSNLPGMIISLAQSFKGLSKQQKQAIKANTTNQVYSMIETAFGSTMDVGDVETISLHSRVHKETFANNLVQALCQCKTYTDVIDVMHDMRSNTAKHGKDKLPTVEFASKNGFGPVGIKVDAHGAVTMNVSPQTAQAEQDFISFLNDNVSAYNVIANFYGEINANVMNVNIITYGTIRSGEKYFVEGDGVTDGTYVVKGITGTGNTGTYIVNQNSQTPNPNTHLIIFTEIKQKSNNAGGGGGGGGGGLTGGIPGISMFGEAAKLIGQSLPIMHPQASQKVQSVLKDIDGGASMVTNIHHLKAYYGKIWHKIFP